MNGINSKWLAALVLLAIAVAAYLFWPRTPEPTLNDLPAAAPTAPFDAPASEPASAPEGTASVPAVAASVAAEPRRDPAIVLPPLADADPLVKETLSGVVGKQAVLTMLQTDGFIQRLVATVDNLPRSSAPSRMWPLHPSEGRFSTDDAGHIAAANSSRYLPAVLMLERIDPKQAATLYRQFYPLMQQAYEELGYPGQRFQARLLEVIDHLLATPQPAQPLKLTLMEIKGPIASERPWVHYEFADPKLEALSAGQKILLRMGDDNRRRVTTWLRAFKAQIAR